MRRLLPLLLLTAATTPAFAAIDPDANEPAVEREARPEREMRPERSRPQRAERAERAEPEPERASPPPRMFERPRRAERAERVESVERIERIAPAERPERPERAERPERVVQPAELGTSEPAVRAERRERTRDTVREWRSREREAERRNRAGELPPPAPSPVIGDVLPSPRTITPPVVASPQAQGDRRTSNVLRNRIATEGWRREWRRDRRYDWRRYREREWNRFHVGIYIDPFGWNYRRWNVGWRLPSRHFASRYWISDPYFYRLPPAYGPYRWVRYWDDALLVDLRTGRVVDVIHDFFW